VFVIKSNHELSEVSYDRIIKQVRSILPEKNILKKNFYVTKSMMKPLNLGYQKINMCPNFYMLYYLKNIDLTEYRICEHSHYKLKTRKEMTLVVHFIHFTHHHIFLMKQPIIN
jgi:hypothetical protein